VSEQYTGGRYQYDRGVRIAIIALTLIALTVAIAVYTPTLQYFGNEFNAGSSKVGPGLASVNYPNVVYVAVNTRYASLVGNALHMWTFGNLTIIEMVADSYAQVKQLASYPYVVSIYGYYQPAQVPEPISNALAFLTQSELEQSLNEAELANYDIIYNVSKLGPTDYPGNNITVCIIDTGIDYLDTDLSHAVWVLVSFTVTTSNGQPLVWINGVNGTLQQAWQVDQMIYAETGHYAWMDRFGHGTMVAGIIASSGVLSNGEYIGLTPGVRLVDIKAFNASGVASINTILNALEWVYNNAEKYDIRVCSFSWGVPVASNGNDPVSLATEQLVNEGIVVVVAAGNSYLFPYTINVPAVAPGVIAVGAWDPWLHEVAFFSSAGPAPNGEVKPDFVAPGVWVTSDIPTTVVSVMQEWALENMPQLIKQPGYMMDCGTSFATPYVAAMAVKAIQYYYDTYHRYPTPQQVKDILIQWSIPINAAGKDIFTGYGLVVGPH
jgi:subtilisin family serine protease